MLLNKLILISGADLDVSRGMRETKKNCTLFSSTKLIFLALPGHSYNDILTKKNVPQENF